MNVTKTTIMLITRNQKQYQRVIIEINNQPIGQVKRLRHLGYWITVNLDPEIDIRSRVEVVGSSS